MSALEKFADVIEKEGIVSILSSHCGTTKGASLRRTLSADMSSKKWLAQSGFFSHMKKIPSHQEFTGSASDSSSSLPSDGEEEDQVKNGLGGPNQSEVWSSIQLEREKEAERPGQFDIWSSILSQKAEDQSKLPPPYIHPLVKRSASSLSKQSLEICTESLGSETGSEGFSSYPPSETGDVEEDGEGIQKRQQQRQQETEYFQSFDRKEFPVVKYNFSGKKSPPRSFPPPLPSRNRGDGASIQMRSYRKDGRLVLEAVSFPRQQNYFHAQRLEGRLLLTLVNDPSDEKPDSDCEENLGDKVEDRTDEEHEEEEKDDDDDDDDDDEEEREEEVEAVMNEKFEKENRHKEMGFVLEPAAKLTSGLINVHRSTLLMTKFIALNNRNTRWPHNFNKAVNLEKEEVELEEEEEEEEQTTLAQSVPPTARVARLIPSAAAAAAASLNACEYFWKTKPAAVASIIYPLTQKCPTLKNTYNEVIQPNRTNNTAFEQQEMLVMRGNKEEYLDPLLKGCKDSKRSLLIWEPCCIATS